VALACFGAAVGIGFLCLPLSLGVHFRLDLTCITSATITKQKGAYN
jgi:hypothetical protein